MKLLKDKPYSSINIPTKTSGIYAIVNNFNGKRYVGSSQDCRERLGHHLSLLRYGKHQNQHLQNAFNQCLIENFLYILLEEVKDLSKLHEREQYWMDYYKSYEKDKGYNKARFAEASARGLVGWNKDSWQKKVSKQQIVDEYLSGLITTDLVLKYHIRPTTIGRILHEANATRSKTGRPKHTRQISIEQINEIENFYSSGHTIRECVKKFGIAQTTLNYYLKERGCLRSNHFQIHPKVTRGY